MISVAMATYNGEQFIEKQLESIMNQTYPIDELVVVDDCSTDKTVELIHKCIEKYPNVTINLVINDKNIGYKKNFYKAISLCTGDYIFLCDQDDIWMKEKVEILYNIMKADPRIELVASSFAEIDESDEVQTKNKNLYDKHLMEKEGAFVSIQNLIFHNIAQGCALLMSKRIKELYIQYCTDKLPHDRIINVIAAINQGFYFYNYPLFAYRIHSNNTIGLADKLQFHQKQELGVRIFDAQYAMEVLDLIKAVDLTYYEQNVFLGEMKIFAENHINAIKNQDVVSLLLQNTSPYYKKLKSFKGRMLDLYFVLKKHNK